MKSEVGCPSACLIQQEQKGLATLVCTLETLKELYGVFLRCAGKGARTEARAVSLQYENNMWVVVETWCSTVCTERIEGRRAVCHCVLVCNVKNFRVEFERLKGGKAPAGEM